MRPAGLGPRTPSSEGAKSWSSGCLCGVGARAGGAGPGQGEKGSSVGLPRQPGGPQAPRVRERFPGGWCRHPWVEGRVLSEPGTTPGQGVPARCTSRRPPSCSQRTGSSEGGAPTQRARAIAVGHIWGSRPCPRAGASLEEEGTRPAYAWDTWPSSKAAMSFRGAAPPQEAGPLGEAEGKPRCGPWLRTGVTPQLTLRLCPAVAQQSHVQLTGGSLQEQGRLLELVTEL